MKHINQSLIVIVLILAVVSLAVGATFVTQAVEKENWMRQAMQAEKVTLNIPETEAKSGNVVDTPEEAQKAADTVREHRHTIAPTYSDLLAGGKYDPNNPKHLTYSQAINMENYLYLSVLGFGVTTIITGIGAFMILVGIALGAVGIVLLRLSPKVRD